MNAQTVKEAAERQPFRPFTIRLNNGTLYSFKGPRDFGAPKNYREVVFFGDANWALIDLDSIAEIILQQLRRGSRLRFVRVGHADFVRC